MPNFFWFGNEMAFLVSSVFGKRKRKCKRKIAFLEKRKPKRKGEASFLSQPCLGCPGLRAYFQMGITCEESEYGGTSIWRQRANRAKWRK